MQDMKFYSNLGTTVYINVSMLVMEFTKNSPQKSGKSEGTLFLGTAENRNWSHYNASCIGKVIALMIKGTELSVLCLCQSFMGLSYDRKLKLCHSLHCQ